MSQQDTRFVFTVNNYTSDDIDQVNAMFPAKAKYLIYAKETAPTTGTPHLQGFVVMKAKITITGMTKLVKRASWQIARGSSKDAAQYCKGDYTCSDGRYKEANPADSVFEFGACPLSAGEAGGNAQKEFWGTVKAMASEYSTLEDYLNAVDEMFPDNSATILHANNLRNFFNRKRKIEDTADIEAEWFMGPPGTGKSHTARAENSSFYAKQPGSKWFDGYDHEDCIIIDDLDSSNLPPLMPFIKNLVDKYAVSVEVKGGSMRIRPKKIVVTSNYHPSVLFTEPTFLAAMTRRFKIRQFNTVYVAPTDAGLAAQPAQMADEVTRVPATQHIDLTADSPLPAVQSGQLRLDAVQPPAAFW